uniref:Sodium/proline symporter n=1 Tax=Candidatus Aschnera chinzeii TaxID=1485666 RepID=A0AAT9G419_9ENTR|nr:MAG: sodium/proline symporter PutP [Candidatus Aschnera chinzeii]
MVPNYQMVIMFVIYIFVMLLIGYLAYRSTSNFTDYILGGRRLGGIVTALSAGASDMSGWLLMGLPGIIFLNGISESWIAIGLSLGAYLNWKLVAGRLRVQTENNNSLTLPDYLTNRFNDKSKILRIISAVVILIFFTIYCASGVVASGLLFESTFGINYDYAMWLGAIAAIIYTFLGGFLAVSWTDTVQATLMIFALLLTPIMVIYSVGGLENAVNIIYNKNPIYLDMFKDLNYIGIISLLGWGFGYFGQPHILARFMAADSVNTINHARKISMTWMILCLLGTMSVGFFAIAYFTNNYDLIGPVADKPERVFIELAGILFNPWLSGIVLSAILAAVMSTLSCQLLVCTSALTEDLYKAFFRIHSSQKELVWVGRIMLLCVASIAIFIARNPNNRVLDLVSNAWAGFGAAFGPVILISVLWHRMNIYGALAGMLAGSITVLIWMQYKWFELYEIIPGFIISSITIFIVSWLTPKPSIEVKNLFIKSEKEYQSSKI